MSNGRTTVEINKDLKERLKKYCKDSGRIQYTVANEAIEDYLEKKEG